MTSGCVFLIAASAVISASIVLGGFSGLSPAFCITALLYQKPAGACVQGKRDQLVA